MPRFASSDGMAYLLLVRWKGLLLEIRAIHQVRSKGDEQHATTKAVVFDVGGVLIDLHSQDAGRELSEKYGLSPDAFARLTRSCFESHPRSITELAMIGQVGTVEYLDAFLTECNVKDLEGLRANRLSVMGRERPSVFAIVKQLKEAGFICCVLSNTITLHWGKLSSSRGYPSFGLFDHVFASHMIECAKPEETAFSFVTNALNLRAAECLLVDDTILNVNGAEAAGWLAVLFTDAAQLQNDISSLLYA
jgi:putative hydrolase of the HAD superfamily